MENFDTEVHKDKQSCTELNSLIINLQKILFSGNLCAILCEPQCPQKLSENQKNEY